ncbi:MAG: membrane protein insertase YidC [Corynebacterium sp.]|nr:membrane protein insertase YidC [Corynebacterium sp.]
MVYPVSGIIKLWHYVMHSLLGLPDNTAWVVSIIGLIITMRAIIAPLSWIQIRNVRRSINMRPHMKELQERYKNLVTRSYQEEQKQKTKELREEYGYRASAGCLPAVIQIPFFIGLYRVLREMARPADGLETLHHHSIGMLTGAEIDSFVAARVNGIPLVAHVMMSPEEYARLGTSHDAVFHFVLPFFIAAAIFTTGNMLHSMYRTYCNMDYSIKSSVVMTKWMWILVIFTPIFPISGGLYGPLPVAVAYYWVATNLWTLVQMVLIYVILDIKLPISPEFKAYQAETKAEYKKHRRENKRIRKNRRRYVLTPWRISALHAENKAIKDERKRLKEEKKRETEMIKKARQAHSDAKVALKITEWQYSTSMRLWHLFRERGPEPKKPLVLAEREARARRREAKKALHDMRRTHDRARRMKKDEQVIPTRPRY